MLSKLISLVVLWLCCVVLIGNNAPALFVTTLLAAYCAYAIQEKWG